MKGLENFKEEVLKAFNDLNSRMDQMEILINQNTKDIKQHVTQTFHARRTGFGTPSQSDSHYIVNKKYPVEFPN